MIPAAEPIDHAKVTPGIGGFLVFVFLIIAAIFLFRSLKKQMGRVDFEEAPAPGDHKLP